MQNLFPSQLLKFAIDFIIARVSFLKSSLYLALYLMKYIITDI